jgi:hypothetical protein
MHLKNQFVRVNALQGNGAPLSNKRILTDAQSGMPPDQLQRGAAPAAQVSHHPSTDVVSSLQPGRPNPSTLADINSLTSIEERDTLEQQVVNSPQTGPALHPSSPQARYANGPSGRVAPHDLAITPPGAFQPGARTFPPPQAPPMQPMQRPPAQPLPPRGPAGPAGSYPFNPPGARNPQSEAVMMPFGL